MSDEFIPKDDFEAIKYCNAPNLQTWKMRRRQHQAEEARGEGGEEPIRKILTDADAIKAGYPNLLSYKYAVRNYTHFNQRAAELRARTETNKWRAQSREASAAIRPMPRPAGF
jgi:hypothetical protein